MSVRISVKFNRKMLLKNCRIFVKRETKEITIPEYVIIYGECVVICSCILT